MRRRRRTPVAPARRWAEARVGAHGGAQRPQRRAVPVRGHRDGDLRRRRRRRSSRRVPRRRGCRRDARPSAETRGTGSPTRSTKPLNSTWPDRVSTDRRVTGGLPTRAATMLVVPIDNPNGSLITDPTIADTHRRSGSDTPEATRTTFWQLGFGASTSDVSTTEDLCSHRRCRQPPWPTVSDG